MKKKTIWLVVSSLMVLLLSSGCGVPQEDSDAAQAQVASLQDELDEAESQIQVLQDELNRAQQVIDAMLARIPTEGEEAAHVEFVNIQSAVTALMVDNELATLPNPVGVTLATSDMSAFPDTTAATMKGSDAQGNRYDAYDKAGFILYMHDGIADSSNSYDLVNYVATRYTKGTYFVDRWGLVTQLTTGYE